jgi:predicted acylesterase/phospholipase RssA
MPHSSNDGTGNDVQATGKAMEGQAPVLVLVNLALQGGGSHGAFTWGVLDRLLDERSL